MTEKTKCRRGIRGLPVYGFLLFDRFSWVLALIGCTSISLQSLNCTAAELPDLDLNAVVQKYLKQESSVERFVAEYTYRAKELNGLGNEEGRGTFGFEAPGTYLAAKARRRHALFNGTTTTYLMGNVGFVAKKPAAAFAEWRFNPALLFDFMQDTEYTRVSRVLSDASGPRLFGEAKLVEGNNTVMDRPCYVIEGKYDRAKLNNLNRPKPVLWKYRLFLDPAHGMQIVRKETTNPRYSRGNPRS